MKSCTVSGCCKPAASSWGKLCNSHKSRNRRHGHPLQLSIKKADLKAYFPIVDEIVERNALSPLWEIAKKRWDGLIDSCLQLVKRRENGQATNSRHVQAAECLVAISEAVPFDDILRTVIAMYLLRDQHPNMFRSDDAFSFQLVRRVRGLSEVSQGTYYDPKSGRVKRVYKDMPPEATDWMAYKLEDVLGPIGIRFAGYHREDLERLKADRKAFFQALGELR
jgi:hypothetical protein